MAGQRTLRGFYVGLIAVAAVGAGAIWWAGQNSSGTNTPLQIEPLSMAGESFPGYTMGSDSAVVEIIEYGDFQCPACAQFAVLTAPDIKQRLVATGQVRYTFRDFPLDTHQNAIPAHLAAACASEQGRFWEMHDLIYFRHGNWALDRRPERRMREFAEAVGLDMDRYNECMDSRRYLGRVAGSRRDGLALGVNSTPTLIVGNVMVPGALTYDSVKVLVDRALEAAR